MAYLIKIIILCTYFISLYFSIFWLVTLEEKLSKVKQEKKNKKQPTVYPFVSIIIPAYNEEDTVQSTIASVLNLDYPKNCYEIIVIDDGSTDSTSEKIDASIKNNSSVPVIFKKQKNQGKAAALNWGLSKSKGDFFACLDADSVVESDILKKMLLFYQEHEKNIVIVTPLMKIVKPKNLLQKFQRVEYILAAFIQRLMGDIDCIYIAPGPFSLYRTKIIQDLGGFDEKNITEDQEIAYRVQSHHFKIRQCPEAFVRTVAPRNLAEFYKQRNRWFKGSLFNLMKYKKMFLNRKYGDFGIFQLPLNLSVYLLGIITFCFFTYYIVKPIWQTVYKIILLNFDIGTILKQFFSSSFDILQLDLGIMFVLYVALSIALYFFYVSHQFSNEKMFEEGVVYLFPYFFLYYVLLSVISIIVLLEMIVGK